MIAALLLLVVAAVPPAPMAPAPMVKIGPARFTPSVSATARDAEPVQVPGFLLDVDLVNRADFAAFVAAAPQWQRGRAPALFVDEHYLAEPAVPLDARAPQTQVSWFAARAYCQARGKRLPTTIEWELAAAASTTKRDGRPDPGFADDVLRWYARPGTTSLPPVGSSPTNAWGVRDLHAVVWEWVDDFGAALVTADGRGNGAPDVLQFCGAAGASALDPTDYAAFMRLAFRSSLDARFALPLLGFRCARDLP